MDYDSLISSKVKDVPPSGIRKYFDIASTMKDAISLGVGEPDFVTPWNIREAAIYSIEKGRTHYTSNRGLAELRDETAKYLAARFDAHYDPETEIIITSGASEGIDIAMRMLVEPGDEVIVPDPSYVAYEPAIRFAGGVPVKIRLMPENGFRIDPDELKKLLGPRVKAIILPYPNNPTGCIMGRAELEAVADVIRGTNAVVLSDEIYAELTYEGEHVSFASIDGMKERTILLSGFSKAFAMTGWRMGYNAAPAALTAQMLKIHQYSALCAPIAGQYAALEALKSGADDGYASVLAMRREYNRRRRYVTGELNSMGLACFEPQGAFYAFPSVRSTGLTSEEFCDRLLLGHGVACVPGGAFGTGGDGFIRCSYATAMPKLVEAMRRIREFLEEL